MKFPVKFGSLNINKVEGHVTHGSYYVNDPSIGSYIDKNGDIRSRCSDCWHYTLKDAALAVVTFYYGSDSIAVRLMDAIDDEELLYMAITRQKRGVVFGVRILTNQDPQEIKQEINRRLSGLEFRIDTAEDVEIPSNYKWDGSFFNTEVSE